MTELILKPVSSNQLGRELSKKCVSHFRSGQFALRVLSASCALRTKLKKRKNIRKGSSGLSQASCDVAHCLLPPHTFSSFSSHHSGVPVYRLPFSHGFLAQSFLCLDNSFSGCHGYYTLTSCHFSLSFHPGWVSHN